MSNRVWIVNAAEEDEEIGYCEFGDDAELIFNNYKEKGKTVWVLYSGMFGELTTHSNNPKFPVTPEGHDNE